MEVLRSLETDHLNAQLYKTELSKHEGDVPLYSAPDSSKIIVIGVISLVVGYLIGMSYK
jgi:hypothetical protein